MLKITTCAEQLNEIRRTREKTGPGTIEAAFHKFFDLRTIMRIPILDGSAKGAVIFVITVIVALVTGYVALFIDLPLVVMAMVSAISLGGLVITGSAVWKKFHSSPNAAYSEKTIYAQSGYRAEGVTGCSTTRSAPTGGIKAALGDKPASPSDLPFPEQKTLHTLAMYWVSPPFAYVKIIRSGKEGFVYTVVAPEITEHEQVVLRETYTYMRDVIVFDTPDQRNINHLDRDNLAWIIRQFDAKMPVDRADILIYYLHRDLAGYGSLDPLMQDPALEDISCSGNNQPVFIFHQDYGSLPTNIVFSEGELNQFVLKLSQKADKQISLTNPMVDATLPGGARVQLTYSDIVSTKGSTFTIRKFRSEPMTPLDLIRFGTYNAEMLAFLWLATEHRRSILVVGGTASGKTSTMNAISIFIPLNAKIVSLEDTREIQLPHKNWLPAQTREVMSIVSKADIDLFSLLKASLRQRPEYIIVGEVRGREAQTLFQAMNTGHATLSTIHAGSVQEAINRLTHDPINVPPVMFGALDLVVVQGIYSYGNTRIRRCLSIHEISVDRHGAINDVPLYEWNSHDDTFRKVSEHSHVLNNIAFTRGWSPEETQKQLQKRVEFLEVSLDVPAPDLADFTNAVHEIGD